MAELPIVEPPLGTVFLSYASQDADAASRICASLGAVGIKVWFDQSKLRSGDAWETTIHWQINSCDLFIPVISAHTNARTEGYFRREWNLAVERTQGMHESRPFLLPVLIDLTSETEALVPERFRKTHWSRLISGEVTPSFSERVVSLLGGTSDPSKKPGTPGRIGLDVDRLPRTNPSFKRVWGVVVAVGVAAIACVTYWATGPKPVSQGVSTPAAEMRTPTTTTNKTIAVIPFENMSDNKDNAYFADGIQEDILTSLALIGDMNVISRTSVMGYRGTTKSSQQIGKELGVAYILEGSVRRSGNTVRVTGQLIDARTGLHAWAKAYDRSLDDIFAIQESLAKDIANSLHSVLTPEDLARLGRKPTESPEAYDLYLKGRAAYYSDDALLPRVERARPLFERAVALDPKFYQGWLELYEVYSTYWEYNASALDRNKAVNALNTANRLSPDAPEVMAVLYRYYSESNDTAKMDSIQRRLAEAYPNNSLSLAIRAEAAQSLLDDPASASKIYQKAVALDPQNIALLDEAGWFYMGTRHYDQCEAMFAAEAAVAPLPPWNLFRNSLIPFLARGDSTQTEAYLASLSPETLRNDESAISAQAEWDYRTGNAQALIRLWQDSGKHWSYAPWTSEHDLSVIAEAFISLGKPDLARPLLENDLRRLKAQTEKEPSDGLRWEGLARTYALLGDEANAIDAHDKMSKCPTKYKSDRWNEDAWVLDAMWLNGKVYKDAAIAKVANLLRAKQVPSMGASVYFLAHGIDMWPIQKDPRFQALLKDPANNAPTF